MKHIDLALEVTKQLIAIATGMLVGVAALARSILEHEQDPLVFSFLATLYTALALSIMAGIVQVGALTNLAEASERQGGSFLPLSHNPTVRNASLVQWFFFFAATAVFIASILVDFSITNAGSVAEQTQTSCNT